jgi:hypothetical protein
MGVAKLVGLPQGTHGLITWPANIVVVVTELFASAKPAMECEMIITYLESDSARLVNTNLW